MKWIKNIEQIFYRRSLFSIIHQNDKGAGATKYCIIEVSNYNSIKNKSPYTNHHNFPCDTRL